VEETVIYFLPDDYELDTANYARLDELVSLSIRFKNAKILIDGHYNGYPDFKVTEFWTSLAQNRAEMIEAYFVSQGIEQSRITIINKGCSEPVNQDDSWQEIQKNRRVVIHFELTNQ
jgi:outer membrane protein OmpA-like peptidoglycan-associated protein